MEQNQSLSHSKWECKHHAVSIPKCRRRTLYAQLRRHLGDDDGLEGQSKMRFFSSWSCFIRAKA
jgi:hypothetical protein